MLLKEARSRRRTCTGRRRPARPSCPSEATLPRGTRTTSYRGCPQFIPWIRARRASAICLAWLDVARDFKETPVKVADTIYAFYTSKGYSMSQDTFRKAMANVDVEPGFPDNLTPYMQEQAEILLKEKKIAAIPDWSKALRPDFMAKARAGA